MYLKIVSGSDTHYIRCNEAVTAKVGADVNATCHIVETPVGGGGGVDFTTLYVEGVSALNSVIVTDGKVYLLDDSGKTVDVIKR